MRRTGIMIRVFSLFIPILFFAVHHTNAAVSCTIAHLFFVHFCALFLSFHRCRSCKWCCFTRGGRWLYSRSPIPFSTRNSNFRHNYSTLHKLLLYVDVAFFWGGWYEHNNTSISMSLTGLILLWSHLVWCTFRRQTPHLVGFFFVKNVRNCYEVLYLLFHCQALFDTAPKHTTPQWFPFFIAQMNLPKGKRR